MTDRSRVGGCPIEKFSHMKCIRLQCCCLFYEIFFYCSASSMNECSTLLVCLVFLIFLVFPLGILGIFDVFVFPLGLWYSHILTCIGNTFKFFKLF